MNLEIFKTEIAKLAQKYHLELVILFGSQATGAVHPKSDIDIAVLSHEPVNRAHLGIQFDNIFMREATEVVDLGQASPTLMYAIVKDGKLLYEKESDSFLKWKLYAIKIWMETAWLRRLATKKTMKLINAF